MGTRGRFFARPMVAVLPFVAVVMLTAGSWARAEERSDRSFLWRVESPTTTVYLLGSVHLMKEDAYPLNPAIEKAYDDARVLVFEVDLDQLTAAALQLLAAGTLPDGKRLRDTLSRETWDLVDSRLADLGMDAAGVQGMRPWLLAVSITTAELARAGYGGAAGVDLHFFERARAEGKPTVELESIDDQVSLFANLSPDEDEAFLRYTIEELDTIIPVVDELVAAWRTGDVTAAESLLTEAYTEFPDLFRRLVSDRNRNWLPQIEQLLAGDQPAMVVVGALHLVGDQGLLELLRRRGYRVEQV